MVMRFGKIVVALAASLGLALATVGPAISGKVAADVSETDQLRERLLKAAFLYNFARFTNWPDEAFADPGDPLNFCLLGEDPFGEAVDAINGKTVKGRKLSVARYTEAAETFECHLLFISRSETTRIPAILAELNGRPILTIADMANFAKSGGVINLKTDKNKLRFEVNLDVARNVGLRFSSRFLSLAKIVQGAAGQAAEKK